MKITGKHRILSLVLSFLLVLSTVPVTAFAADDDSKIASTEESTPAENQGVSENEADAVGGEENIDTADAAEYSGENENDSTGVASGNRVEVNGTGYATLEEAVAAAEPVDGVITYDIYGKVEANSTDSWIQVLKDGLTGVTGVAFVGKTSDAELSITNTVSVLADQKYDINVSFNGLTLSHPNGVWVNDLGHATEYFACVLRNTDAANNTVTYTNCTFPNGVCNNLYGKTVFEGCQFTNETSGKYNLWNYGGITEIKNGGTFTSENGNALYEGIARNGNNQDAAAKSYAILEITGGTFIGAEDKDAVAITRAEDKAVISGGEFSSVVDEAYCAPGFIPVEKANANGNYVVEEGKFTVQVTSRTIDSSNTVATVTGGGVTTYEKGMTATTTEVAGYEFVGWYVDSYPDGKMLGTSMSVSYQPVADCTLIAVYKPVEGGTFTLKVTASRYTVSGKSLPQSDSRTFTMNVNSDITVKYIDESRTFRYWVTGSDKIVSTSPEYKFVLGSNTELRAVTAEDLKGQGAMVVFMSSYDQVISSETYAVDESILFPAGPARLGYNFIGWDKTEAEIKTAMATENTIIVKPLYESNGMEYTITVKYDGVEKAEETYTLPVGDSKLVEAEGSIDGKAFAYWKDSDGKILSYQTSMTIRSTKDVSVIAVYGATAEKTATINITDVSADRNGTYYRLNFVQNYALAEGETLVQTGFVGTTDGNQATEALLTLENAEQVYKSILTSSEGSYTHSCNLSDNELIVYMRAYVQYRDADGKLHTLYSGIVGASYSSLTNGGV